MKCSKCDTELLKGAKYCTSCGTIKDATNQICNKCNAVNPDNAKYCLDCGTPLEEVSLSKRLKKSPALILSLIALGISIIVLFVLIIGPSPRSIAIGKFKDQCPGEAVISVDEDWDGNDSVFITVYGKENACCYIIEKELGKWACTWP